MAAARIKSDKNTAKTEVEVEMSQTYGVVKDRRDFTIKWDFSDLCEQIYSLSVVACF